MSAPTFKREFVLDLARAIAVSAVLTTHAVAIVLGSYQQVGSFGLWSKVFYLTMSLGHQAVVIFFVLSGFLIGREVLKHIDRGTWRFWPYAIKRTSRLYIVLIPALCMTAVLDGIGKNYLHADIYSSNTNALYGSTIPLQSALDLKDFFQNLLFLQTITTGTFGSNTPLWSLANEFWYYSIFAFIVIAVATKANRITRLVCFGIVIVFIYLYPTWLVAYGIIWLAGVAFAWMSLNKSNYFPAKIPRAFALLAFVASVCIGRTTAGHWPDFLLAFCFSTALVCFIQMEPKDAIILRSVRFMSDISYSLYLFHFPFLCLASYWITREDSTSISSGKILTLGTLVFAAVAYTLPFYLAFEFNTKKVQKRLLKLDGSARLITIP